MRSETPESVRLTVNVKLHGGNRAAVKMNQRIEGGGAGRERVPFESEEKILLLQQQTFSSKEADRSICRIGS